MPEGLEEETISFKGAGGVNLEGSFVSSSDPSAYVLLIADAGTTDRNGSQQPVMKAAVLQMLAYALADDGIASFRFDKRLTHEKAEDPAEYIRWTNQVVDTQAAWAELKELAGDKPAFLFGHGEGGLMALTIAADVEADGVILAGTPGRPYGEIINDQVKAALDKKNLAEDKKLRILEESKRAQNRIKASGKTPFSLPRELKRTYLTAAGKMLQEILKIDPLELAATVEEPILVLQPEFDHAIRLESDSQPLMEAFESRLGGEQSLVELEGTSHHLKLSTGFNLPGISGDIKPEAVDAVVEWISERTKE